MYNKQGFKSGEKLKASQLEKMEDGIIEAQKLASQGVASAVNMEKGAGTSAVQQLPDNVADGFDFTGKNENATTLDATLTGVIPYGATGDFANAFGGKCAAQGKRSHAEGTTTIAKGKYSHVEGDNSVALGDDSHAEGAGTVAGFRDTSLFPELLDKQGKLPTAQHAEGIKTIALGAASHAEGEDTTAKGNCSHAGGWFTEVGGAYSFGHGAGLKINKNSQTAFGNWNLPTQSPFIIGGGNKDNRQNLFEIRQNGDICMRYGNKMYSLHKFFDSLGASIASFEIDLSDEVTE